MVQSFIDINSFPASRKSWHSWHLLLCHTWNVCSVGHLCDKYSLAIQGFGIRILGVSFRTFC